MSEILGRAEAALGRALGRSVHVHDRTPLGGGSISRTDRLDTDAGAFVLKTTREAPPGLFRSEAAGLAALRAATSLTVPRVVVYEEEPPSFLILDHVPAGRRRPDFDERLGRGLAELHRASASRFGFDGDNFCGRTPQPNGWTSHWVDFYARRRLGHQMELAASAGLLSGEDARRVERLIVRLDAWIAEPAEGPALVHGDLWSGNVLVDAAGHPALIDPAVSYGHREAEFGIMTLFGGFPPRVFDAYAETYALEPGWRERNGLYQLYHLMNHLNLFGEGYHRQVMAAVERYS
jgi:fructosamine-3-kinase